MKQNRLLRGEMPLPPKPFSRVERAKFPERGIPGRRIAFVPTRPGSDKPTPDDFAQKSVPKEALPVEATELRRPEDASPLALKRPQSGKGVGELFMRCDHMHTNTRF